MLSTEESSKVDVNVKTRVEFVAAELSASVEGWVDDVAGAVSGSVASFSSCSSFFSSDTVVLSSSSSLSLPPITPVAKSAPITIAITTITATTAIIIVFFFLPSSFCGGVAGADCFDP